MPATDPLYDDIAYEIRQKCRAQQEATPRAFALREEVKTFFRELPLGHPLDEPAGLALDDLNSAIEFGIEFPEEAETVIRQRLGLPRRSA